MSFCIVADWRCDQYHWKKNNGTVNFPNKKKEPVFIRKYYHKLYEGSSFCRHAWWLIDNPTLVLVHYLGDHHEYEPQPHGNSKSRRRPYVRTCPSLISEIKKTVSNPPAATYHRMVNQANKNHVAHEAVLKPKNIEQIENAIKSEKNKQKISHDQIYNANLIAHELHDYLYEIRTYPELIFFMAHPEIISEFNTLLMMESKDQLYCVYDTTFTLGDFYITPVCFRHILFEKNPIIPLAFLLHGKKLQFDHEDFITSLSRRIPNFKKSNIPVIVDRERSITNAFESVLPNIHVIHCWNHLKNDFKRWLQKNGAKSDEIPIYRFGLEQILKSETPELFEENCKFILSHWSRPAVDYFNKYLKNDILKYSVKFVLEQNNIYNPYSGITNNAAESFNAVIKRLMEWKEAPADTISLCFYYLQNYYLKEIYRGFCNLGSYQLKSDYADLVQNPEHINFPKDTCAPNDIVDKVKENIKHFASEDSNDQKIFQHATPCKNSKDNIEPKEYSKEDFMQRNMSQIALAQSVIDMRRIELEAKTGTFVVVGTRGDKYAVTLFPTESCKCPATNQCYHILAARKAIGMDISLKKRKINTSRLGKRKKNTANKRSGRKKPRVIDYDYEFLAAPDSEKMLKEAPMSQSSDVFCESDSSIDQSNNPTETCLGLNANITSKIDLNESNAKNANEPSLRSILKTPSKKKRVNIKLEYNETKNISLENSDLDLNMPSLKKTFVKNKDQQKKNRSTTQISNVPIKVKAPQNNLNMSTINMKQNYDRKTLKTGFSPKERKIRYWSEYLGLTLKNKRDIENDLWLSDNHVRAAHKLLKTQFPHIEGMEDTIKCPSFNKQTKSWVVPENGFKTIKTGPSLQIHFTGQTHWLLSVKTDKNIPFVIDSMRSSEHGLTSAKEIQLCQIYENNGSDIDVFVISPVLQTNHSDCGVYAIANAVEFANNGLQSCLDEMTCDWIYDEDKMRIHLLKCFEKKQLTPFPKIGRKHRIKLKPKHHKIVINCPCRLPNFFHFEMIGCSKCNASWHKKCVQDHIENLPLSNEDFVCPSCCNM